MGKVARVLGLKARLPACCHYSLMGVPMGGAMEIISREEAKKQGRVRYYTGIPCQNGHIAERLVKSKRCAKCRSETARRMYEKPEHRAKVKAAQKRYMADPAYRERRNKVIREYRSRPDVNRRLAKMQSERRRTPDGRRKRREEAKKYYNSTVERKIKSQLRSRLRNALHGKSKAATTIELLGCSIEQFKGHISRQFEPGMSWSNYGEWHIDHITPVSHFDLSAPDQQRRAFHYTNTQPMWAEENFRKGDRYIERRPNAFAEAGL